MPSDPIRETTDLDREVVAIQTEWLVEHRTHRRVMIAEEPAGWSVHLHTADGVAPPSIYPTAEQAAARVLQLLKIREPVTPQDWPEEVCIGTVRTVNDDAR
jgi:hypothetical protein